MDFYTNVVRYGNNLLIREVVNGQRVNSKLKYKPTMFVPVVKPTNWKTLDDKICDTYGVWKYKRMF